MTDEEFLLIRDCIFDYCGIFVPEGMKFLVERRLRARLAVLGLDSFRDYYRLIRYSPMKIAELDSMVELITTNETYFFREFHQLRAFVEEIVPALLQRRKKGETMRIWSAGCSSGEEPYTLAMLINDLPQRDRFEIFGSDISRKAIRLARAAVYRDASFRDIDPAYVSRYFVAEGKNRRLGEEVRQMVTFGHLNLMDDAAMELVANVDVIFCRNVMIYFSKTSRSRLLRAFFRKLREGGYLLLGHSESLLNVSTDFEIVALQHDIVYRKPTGGGGR